MNEVPGKNSNDQNEINGLRAQIEKLRQELARNRNEEAEEPPLKKKSRGRSIGAGVLLGFGLILLLIAIPVLWLHRTLLTTDGWVTAVGPLAEDPAVQDAVANAAAQEYTRQVDIEAWVRNQLPEQSSGLAVPLTAVIEMAIRQFARMVVSSDAFATIWREVNRVSHSLAIAGLSGVENVMDGELNERAGELIVDLRLIIERLQQELAARGFVFKLPEKFNSQVTLLQSGQLAQLVNLVRTLDTVAPWLTFLAIVTIAGAIGISPDRRKTILIFGIGIATVGLLLLISDSILKWRVIESVSPGAIFTPEATAEAYETITGGLVASLRAAVLLGIILWAGSVALGPSSSMISMRHHLREWIHNLGKNRTPGHFELWVGANRSAIQAVVLIIASIALIIPSQRTMTYILVLALLVIIVEFLVEFFGRVSSPPAAHV